MPGKMARSASRPPFGLPDALVAVCISRRSCRKAGKARIHASSELSGGIPVETTTVHDITLPYLRRLTPLPSRSRSGSEI